MTDYRSQGSCADTDPEVFFPLGETWSGGNAPARAAAAKAICEDCSVTAKCLDDVLKAGDDFAVAGGTTPDERRAMSHEPASADERLLAAVGRADNQSELKAAGQALGATGRSATEVAELCGVSERTAQRWAQQSTDLAAERAAAGLRELAQQDAHDASEADGTRAADEAADESAALAS